MAALLSLELPRHTLDALSLENRILWRPIDGEGKGRETEDRRKERPYPGAKNGAKPGLPVPAHSIHLVASFTAGRDGFGGTLLGYPIAQPLSSNSPGLMSRIPQRSPSSAI